jgi:hypothetical protein
MRSKSGPACELCTLVLGAAKSLLQKNESEVDKNILMLMITAKSNFFILIRLKYYPSLKKNYVQDLAH